MATKKKLRSKKGLSNRNIHYLAECQKQTQSFKGALFKSFPTKEEAQNYLEDKPSVNISEQDDDRYYIYVDGSYINGEYSWGMAIFYKGKLIDTSMEKALP